MTITITRVCTYPIISVQVLHNTAHTFVSSMISKVDQPGSGLDIRDEYLTPTAPEMAKNKSHLSIHHRNQLD